MNDGGALRLLRLRRGVVVFVSTVLWAPSFAQPPKPPLKPLHLLSIVCAV
ncbi:MAG: hypothetical protein WA642_14470 [Steroidobacteraceae bacterium]